MSSALILECMAQVSGLIRKRQYFRFGYNHVLKINQEILLSKYVFPLMLKFKHLHASLT